jgi:signal transduction histidine kinase
MATWIWREDFQEKSSCRLWRSVVIPHWGKIESVHLRITADNAYQLWFDARLIGQGGDFHHLTDYDLTAIAHSGSHVLAVQAFNEAYNAGVILGLRVEFQNGKLFDVISDKSWWVAPDADEKWLNASSPGASWRRPVSVNNGQSSGDFKRVLAAAPIQPVVIAFWQSLWFQVITLIFGSFVTFICIVLVGRLTAQRRSHELIARERERIAMDIHDDFGARLTHLVLRGELAQTQLDSDSQGIAHIVELSDAARRLRGALDEVIWAVSSRRDTLAHTVSRVCNHAQSFFEETNIRCRFVVAQGLPRQPMDLAVRRTILSAVSEALSNSLRYSEATEVFVRFTQEHKDLVIVVEDNGLGFVPHSDNTDRNGLKNMAFRMKDIGGNFELNSAPGQGTRVTFRIPLKPRFLNGYFSWLSHPSGLKARLTDYFQTAKPS